MSNLEVRTTTQKVHFCEDSTLNGINYFYCLQGRGVFATVPIKADTVLFEEAPLVSAQFSWNYTYGYLVCEYCLKPLETAETNVRRLANDFSISLPYIECCPVQEQLSGHTKCPDCRELYCSEECMHTAAKLYHRVLCLGAEKNNMEHPTNVLVEFWKYENSIMFEQSFFNYFVILEKCIIHRKHPASS